MLKFYRIFLRSLYTLLYKEIINIGSSLHYFSYCYPLPVTNTFFRDYEIYGLPEKQKIQNAMFQALRTCFVPLADTYIFY